MLKHTLTLLLTIPFFLSAQQLDLELFKSMTPRNIGPAGMSGRVTAIDAVIVDPDMIFIGTASGGAWKSTNGGTSWTPIFENEKASSVGPWRSTRRTRMKFGLERGKAIPAIA